MKLATLIAWLKWRRSSLPCRAFISSEIHFTASAYRTASSPRGWRWSRLLPAFHSLPRFSFCCFYLRLSPQQFTFGCFGGNCLAQFSLLFLRQLFQNHLIGLSDQLFYFRLAQRVHFDHCHPMVSRHIRRWNDALHFHQFRKFLRRAFEGNLRRTHSRLKIGATTHLSGNAKEQIVLPLNVFRGMQK